MRCPYSWSKKGEGIFYPTGLLGSWEVWGVAISKELVWEAKLTSQVALCSLSLPVSSSCWLGLHCRRLGRSRRS